MSVRFFFSSRRRHTRFDCDWSSDVCSSDLQIGINVDGSENIVRANLALDNALGGITVGAAGVGNLLRSEEHTSELQSQSNLVCRLLLEKKKKNYSKSYTTTW